jgi:hypothetical protein
VPGYRQLAAKGVLEYEDSAPNTFLCSETALKRLLLDLSLGQPNSIKRAGIKTPSEMRKGAFL